MKVQAHKDHSNGTCYHDVQFPRTDVRVIGGDSSGGGRDWDEGFRGGRGGGRGRGRGGRGRGRGHDDDHDRRHDYGRLEKKGGRYDEDYGSQRGRGGGGYNDRYDRGGGYNPPSGDFDGGPPGYGMPPPQVPGTQVGNFCKCSPLHPLTIWFSLLMTASSKREKFNRYAFGFLHINR